MVFRYNDSNNNLSVVGIFLPYFGGLTSNIYIYGNLFRGQAGTAQRYIEVRKHSDGIGPLFIYNNTFFRVNQAINLNARLSSAGQSFIRNKLFVGVENGSAVNQAFSDEHLTASDTLILSESQMFLSPGSSGVLAPPYDWQWMRDLRLKPGAAAVDAGATLGSPFDFDMLNYRRGNDGRWDVGAYEAQLGGTRPAAPATLRVIPR